MTDKPDPSYVPDPDLAAYKQLGGRLAALGHSMEQDLESPRALAGELVDIYPKVLEAMSRRIHVHAETVLREP